MNKLSALALGAALAVAAPVAATAQDTDLDLDLDSGVGVELGGDTVVGVDAGADAGVELDLGALTHADVDTAIQSSGSVDLGDVDATTDIRVVTLSSLAANDGGDASVLADSRAAHEADITALQGKVSANADVVAALEAEGYSAQDVIAVSTQGSGTVVLFVDA
ncbi:hypothetical protein [Pelagibacterium sediminicola]|uniref:hypothetical protein n=1 Tax=Pelagibacterium sediminicola TaxID=2248761 RepID=UPI001300373E|nr:hypothetical protein [Pelagibacterium sediminicola]